MPLCDPSLDLDQKQHNHDVFISVPKNAYYISIHLYIKSEKHGLNIFCIFRNYAFVTECVGTRLYFQNSEGQRRKIVISSIHV